jgi:benzoyl-CoA reductase subunit C
MKSEDEETHMKGEAILPEFVCDHCQSCLGQAIEGDYKYLDGLLISDACANVRTLLRAWETHIQTPYTFFFTPPFEPTEEGRLYYTKEMVRFNKSLEDFCKSEISDAALVSAIEIYNENRNLMKELYKIRAQQGIFLTGSQIVEVVRSGFVLPKDKHNKMLRRLLKWLMKKTNKNEKKRGIPLFLSLFIFEDCVTEGFNLVEMIETLGGDVVGDDLCMGPRYFSEPVQPKPDLIEAMVDRYLGKIPVGLRYPLKPRIEWLLKQIQQYHIKGAVFVVPRYCHPYLFEYPYIERDLNAKGIRTLFIESEAGMPQEPLRVRLQAFMEMLSQDIQV